MPLRHVAERAANLEKTAVAAFRGTRVHSSEARRVFFEAADETGLGTPFVSFCMKTVNQEAGARKELGLAKHAIRAKSAREVVDDDVGRFLPARKQRREHVVAAFALRNTMKAEANAVRTPRCHKPTRLASDTIGLEVLGASDSTCARFRDDRTVNFLVTRKMWILGAEAYTRAAIEYSCLIEFRINSTHRSKLRYLAPVIRVVEQRRVGSLGFVWVETALDADCSQEDEVN